MAAQALHHQFQDHLSHTPVAVADQVTQRAVQEDQVGEAEVLKDRLTQAVLAQLILVAVEVVFVTSPTAVDFLRVQAVQA